MPNPHIRLTLTETVDTNKKLPPQTIFMSCKDGEIGPAKAGGASVRFAFEKTKSTLVHQAGGGLMMLYELIEKTGATGICRHIPWSGGIPTTVEPQKSETYFTFNKLEQFWEAVQRADNLAIAWVLKLTEKKILTPTAFTLHSVKQLIIPTAGSLTLL